MKILCEFVIRKQEAEYVLKEICEITKNEDVLSFGYHYVGDGKRKC